MLQCQHNITKAYRIFIEHCHFEYNNKHSKVISDYGGGLFADISVCGTIELTLTNSIFLGNYADHGGAIAIRYNQTIFIRQLFSHCKFEGNEGTYGGGLYMEVAGSEFCEVVSDYIVSFESCRWIKNSGMYGSAVIITPPLKTKACGVRYHYVKPLFKTCSFYNNSASYTHLNQWWWLNYKAHKCSKGVLLTKCISIVFVGANIFSHNKGSAIYLLTSDIIFIPGSRVQFQNNIGQDGGAIALYPKSTLKLSQNVSITFRENEAIRGGAIFKKDEDNSPFLCTIQDKNGTDKNISRHLYFLSNLASQGGKSIFSSSLNLRSCRTNILIRTSCQVNKSQSNTIHLNFNECRENELEPLGLLNNSTIQRSIVPGKPTKLFTSKNIPTLRQVDQVTIEPNDSEVVVSLLSIYSNEIILYGKPGNNATIKLYLKDMVLSVDVHLKVCPPGFIYDPPTKVCMCSDYYAQSKESNRYSYKGIRRCDANTFQAYIMQKFWAGYIQDKFCTSPCPLGFCNREADIDTLLPQDSQDYILNKNVCDFNRNGILCGTCTENHTVFFHDNELSCQKAFKCKWGWFFYLISEILPATIFFVLIILLNITLTTGGVSGFLFYVQTFDNLLLLGHYIIWFENKTYKWLKALRFIVRIFNLSFFSLREISFCVIENANALDMIAFNYITLLYCLFLVLATIAVMKRCSAKLRMLKFQLSKSIIHGLSSFLVLCYYQCTRINLTLLSYANVCNSARVFHNGDLAYFNKEHLKYAIPAILFSILVTTIPPVLLLSYPLCYKLLAACHMHESKLTKILCIIIPLEKYKPLFDAFQSSFKDDHRYFAGLYLVYRLLIISVYLFVLDLENLYITVEVLLILILSIHSCIQPYKKRSHNLIDTLLFLLLLLLNTITLFNYKERTSRYFREDVIHITSSIQVTLAWLPLITMTCYLGQKGISAVKAFLLRKPIKQNNDTELISSSSLLDIQEERQEIYNARYNNWKK